MSVGGLSELLKASQRRYVEVPIAEVQTTFRLQSLTEGERSRFEASLVGKNGKATSIEAIRRKLLVLCLVDGDGNRFLGDGDADKLLEIDGAVTGKLFDEASKLVGLGASDVEGLAGN